MDSETLIQIVALQSDSFHELQSQAHRILRSLIALFTLAVAFTQTEFFYSLLEMRVPESVIVIGDGVEISGFYQSFATYHLLTVGSMFVIFASLIFDSGIWAYRVLRTSPIQPGMANEGTAPVSLLVATGSLNRGNIAGWIQSNQGVLEECHHRLQSSYRRVTESVFFLFLSFTILWGIYNAALRMIVLADLLIIFLGIGYVLYNLRIIAGAGIEGWRDEEKGALAGLKRQLWTLEKNTPSIIASYIIIVAYLIALFIGIFGVLMWADLMLFT